MVLESLMMYFPASVLNVCILAGSLLHCCLNTETFCTQIFVKVDTFEVCLDLLSSHYYKFAAEFAHKTVLKAYHHLGEFWASYTFCDSQFS